MDHASIEERQTKVTTTLYDLDFYDWALRQADLLRNEDYADLDRENLIEEIEDMARRHRDALESHLVVLLRHLLKVSCLPYSNPARGWRLTIKEQRYQILRLLKNNPSLHYLMPEMVLDLYPQARDLAMSDLADDDLDERILAEDCPWTQAQILDLNWLP